MRFCFSLFIVQSRRSLVAFISPVLHHLPQQVGLTAMVAPRAGKLCCAVTIRFAFLFGEPFFFRERKMVERILRLRRILVRRYPSAAKEKWWEKIG